MQDPIWRSTEEGDVFSEMLVIRSAAHNVSWHERESYGDIPP